MIRVLTAVLLAPLLAGASCIYIEDMAITTNAVGCEVTRGSSSQIATRGELAADVLAQSGAGAAATDLARMLSSEIDCTERDEDDTD